MNDIRKVLVTGGAGFLGSHLCDRLLGEGCHVICADDMSTGNLSNIGYLFGKESGFEFIRHDITQPLNTDAGQIYNLACPASPVHYQADPIRTAKTSFIGVMNMLELARSTGARLLQASTSEVYGDSDVHPQPETYWGHVNPIGIRACYDEGKRAAETLVFDYRRQYGTDVKVVRIFNTYGPRMDIHDGRVVSNFIMQALRGEDITIYGDGSQTRSFCYVDDLIDGLVRMMDSREGFTGPVNLGNPDEITIVGLAETVVKMTGSKSKIVHVPLPPDDPYKRKPTIELAKRELDWTPTISLETGLGKTIEYFHRLISEGKA